MNKLDQFAKKISGVISLRDVDNADLLLNQLHNLLISESNYTEFYFILHNETDTLHIHYLIEVAKRVRLGTLINFLANNLGLNTLAISSQKCTSKCAMFRYLMHSDNPEKKQYSLSDIHSNMSMDYMDELLKKNEDDELNFDRLVFIIKDCGFKEFTVMQYLGLKTYHKYRYEIKQLLDNPYEIDKYYESKHNTLEL